MSKTAARFTQSKIYESGMIQRICFREFYCSDHRRKFGDFLLCQIQQTKKIPVLPFLLSIFIFQCNDRKTYNIHFDLYVTLMLILVVIAGPVSTVLAKDLKRIFKNPIHPCKLLQKISTDFLMIKVLTNKFLSRNNVMNKNKMLNHFVDNTIILRNNDAIRKYFFSLFHFVVY